MHAIFRCTQSEICGNTTQRLGGNLMSIDIYDSRMLLHISAKTLVECFENFSISKLLEVDIQRLPSRTLTFFAREMVKRTHQNVAFDRTIKLQMEVAKLKNELKNVKTQVLSTEIIELPGNTDKVIINLRVNDKD